MFTSRFDEENPLKKDGKLKLSFRIKKKERKCSSSKDKLVEKMMKPLKYYTKRPIKNLLKLLMKLCSIQINETNKSKKK
jgi:hypothetical protein